MEAFGMSPGTLDQLQSTHVYTEKDFEQLKGYADQVNCDLIDMTESPLYPGQTNCPNHSIYSPRPKDNYAY